MHSGSDGDKELQQSAKRLRPKPSRIKKPKKLQPRVTPSPKPISLREEQKSFWTETESPREGSTPDPRSFGERPANLSPSEYHPSDEIELSESSSNVLRISSNVSGVFCSF